MTRKMESEADYIGLMMMAEAGFDPRAAIGYWERMQSLARRGGQEVPELLSTHPSVSHHTTDRVLKNQAINGLSKLVANSPYRMRIG